MVLLRAAHPSGLMARSTPSSAAARPVAASAAALRPCCGAIRSSVRTNAAADTTLDNFSFSDAKRANDYSVADVQQALAFYEEGEVGV